MGWLRRLGSDMARETAAWRIRCTRCGHERSLSEARAVRYKASGTKWSVGFCQKCRRVAVTKICRPAG